MRASICYHEPMKSTKWAILSIIYSVFLVACGEGSKIKTAAIEAAREKVEKQYAVEGQTVIGVQKKLYRDYVEYHKSKTEYEVVDWQRPSDNTAIVKVGITAIHPQNRETLAKIAATVPPGKPSSGFSMGEAMRHIMQRPEVPPEYTTQELTIPLVRSGEKWNLAE